MLRKGGDRRKSDLGEDWMVEIVGSSRGEVEIMQGCGPAEEYGSLMSVQGCLDLISACKIVRPPEAFPDGY
jgi:hypothetical protein